MRVSKLTTSATEIFDKSDQGDETAGSASGQEYQKFRGINSPDEPCHKVLPWRRGITFGSALQLPIINFDG